MLSLVARAMGGALVLGAMLPAAPAAQTRPPSPATMTPESAATAFFRAMESEQWNEAARWMHPEALARLREAALERAALARAPGTDSITPEEVMRDDPDMPRVVAEYQARKWTENMRQSARLARTSLGATSREEFEAMSPGQLVARLVEESDPRRIARAVAREQADTVGGKLLVRAIPPTVRTVIGHVAAPDRADAAYVLYRSAPRYPAPLALVPEQTAVLHMRRDGAEWRVNPGGFDGSEVFGTPFSFGFSVSRAEGSTLESMLQGGVWPAQGPPRLRVRMEEMGEDPLRTPPTRLVVEQLAADGTVEARIRIPAEAWERLRTVVDIWGLLLLPGDDDEP
jgi:hypothetical protein